MSLRESEKQLNIPYPIHIPKSILFGQLLLFLTNITWVFKSDSFRERQEITDYEWSQQAAGSEEIAEFLQSSG